MIILPAIDIKDGGCVRLYKGDFATAHKVADDPLLTAKQFEQSGARWLHMVDLDGAKDGERKNAPVFLDIAKNTSLKIELGGGIRDMQAVSYYLQRGVSRVVIGSAAVSDPEFVKSAVKEYGDKIAVGIDAKNGMAATHGWLETSGISYIELAKAMEQAGVRRIIFTDISRDGMQQGVNLEQLEKINNAVSCDIIASGGARDMDDVRACAALGLYGMICGKSIYAGSLSLSEAIEAAGEQQC